MTEQLEKQPDIDYLEFANDSIERTLNKLIIEVWELRKDVNATSIWLKELDDWADEMSDKFGKHQKADGYFQSSLKNTHKQYYEKFESLFLKINQLFGKRRADRYTIK